MRRLLTSMAALCFLGAVLGCRHTAGQCDCDGCCGDAPVGPIAPAPILKPEPLQMPKADANGAAAKPAELPDKDNKKEENKDN